MRPEELAEIDYPWLAQRLRREPALPVGLLMILASSRGVKELLVAVLVACLQALPRQGLYSSSAVLR